MTRALAWPLPAGPTCARERAGRAYPAGVGARRRLRDDTRLVKNLGTYALDRIRAPTPVISARDDGFGTYAGAEYTSAASPARRSSASSAAGTCSSATTRVAGLSVENWSQEH